jgi:hypothetical protein
MAKIVEEVVVIKLSKLVKENAESGDLSPVVKSVKH